MFTSRLSRPFHAQTDDQPRSAVRSGQTIGGAICRLRHITINRRNELDHMTALTSPRFLRSRQFGSRRQVGHWSAPLGAVIGDVCARASVAADVESMTGRSDYGQPKRSIGAGSANGGRTP